MRQPADEPPPLPERSYALGLGLSFPLFSLASIQRGFESQGQDDKWSIYFDKLWVQIWRPSRKGMYCYAVRFERTDDQRLEVVESWLGHKVREAEWFGPDLERHREIVTFLLESVGGASCKR